MLDNFIKEAESDIFDDTIITIITQHLLFEIFTFKSSYFNMTLKALSHKIPFGEIITPPCPCFEINQKFKKD